MPLRPDPVDGRYTDLQLEWKAGRGSGLLPTIGHKRPLPGIARGVYVKGTPPLPLSIQEKNPWNGYPGDDKNHVSGEFAEQTDPLFFFRNEAKAEVRPVFFF